MTQEKILWFLGLEEKQVIDKFPMKYAFWSDFLFTFFIVVCGLLFEVITLTFFNIIWLAILIFVDILFLIFLKLIDNPVSTILYSAIVFTTTAIKLAYGFLMFSKAELIKDGYPIITWVHISILMFAVLVSVFMLVKNNAIWQDLKKSSIDQVTEKIQKKNKKSKWKWIAIVLSSSSPMFFVRLFDNGMTKMGLGIGFGFWLLACCWLIMVCLLIPKFIVSIKYNVFECFK